MADRGSKPGAGTGLSFRVSAVVEGVPVLGRVVLNDDYDLDVESVEPFAGLRTGLHIPVFARQFHRFGKDGQLTRYGEQRAQDLLAELYGAHRVLVENAAAIHAELARLLAQRSDELARSLTAEAYQAARRELRAALRQGRLSPAQHAGRMRQLRLRRDLGRTIREEAAWELVRFVRERFGASLSAAQADELVRHSLQGGPDKEG